MSLKSLVTTLLAVTIFSAGLTAGPGGITRTRREAVRLYENGMYGQARTLFESLSGDPLSEGYTVLCAMKQRAADYPELLADYERRHPASGMSSLLHFEYGRLLFDEGRYERAATEFSEVAPEALTEAEMTEYVFKYG